MAALSLWQRFQMYFLEYSELGFSLDISRMKFPDGLFEKMRPQIEHAFAAMRELTDQDPYVRQLRAGALNFFVTFVEVRNDRRGGRFEVQDGITAGDFLQGFLRGTRSALYERGRNNHHEHS